MLGVFAFLGFMALAGFLFLRMLKSREEHQQAETDIRIERPKRLSSRERKLAKIKEFEDSLPDRPTIQELMAEEVRDTGVDEIPGGDDLEIPVRLKVWHRDEHVRKECSDGALRFAVRDGVDRARATEDDVMLVCDASAPSEPIVTSPTIDDGSLPAANGDADGPPEESASTP